MKKLFIYILIIFLSNNICYASEPVLLDKVLCDIISENSFNGKYDPYEMLMLLRKEAKNNEIYLEKKLKKLILNTPACLKKASLESIEKALENSNGDDLIINKFWNEIFTNPEALKQIKSSELKEIIALNNNRKRMYNLMKLLAYEYMMIMINKDKKLENSGIFTVGAGKFDAGFVDKVYKYKNVSSNMTGNFNIDIDSEISRNMSMFFSASGIGRDSNIKDKALGSDDLFLNSLGIKYAFSKNSYSIIGKQENGLKSEIIGGGNVNGISYSGNLGNISSFISYYKYDEKNGDSFNNNDSDVFMAQIGFRPINLMGEFYIFNDIPFNINKLNTTLYAVSIDGLKNSTIPYGWYEGRQINSEINKKYFGLTFSSNESSKYSFFGEYAAQIFSGGKYYENNEVSCSEAFMAGMGINTDILGKMKISYSKYGDAFIKSNFSKDNNIFLPGFNNFDTNLLYGNNYNRINLMIDKSFSKKINLKSNIDIINNSGLTDISELLDRKSSHIGIEIWYSLNKDGKMGLKYDTYKVGYSFNRFVNPLDKYVMDNYQNMILEYSIPIL